jgi:hypothetical protein
LGWLWKSTEEITLTHGDIERLEVVLSELHGKPIGTDASWDNPKSRNSYNGQDCEVLQYDLQNADRHERHVFASCLQPDVILSRSRTLP